jgi:hypothetical protein
MKVEYCPICGELILSHYSVGDISEFDKKGISKEDLKDFDELTAYSYCSRCKKYYMQLPHTLYAYNSGERGWHTFAEKVVFT